VFLSAALIASFVIAQPAPKFEIKDGDRIVWIGSTLVEREQRYGYWETALHAAFPDKQFTVRNLGWSGDTVFGEARGRFDFNNPDACFKQLVNLTLELKPTVIFVSYGTNESFEGEAGLPKFEKGLEKLLNALKPAKARVVLFTPLPFEIFKGGHALKKRNDQLSAYSSAIKRIANRRGLILADLEHCVAVPFSTTPPLTGYTENGMHLTESGYRGLVGAFLESLQCRHEVVDWSKQEPLRQAIVEKNQLFFYRWRPQNETYLFGFRKHEQGKNAKEVAEFDPLVSKAEERIEALRKKLDDIK